MIIQWYTEIKISETIAQRKQSFAVLAPIYSSIRNVKNDTKLLATLENATLLWLHHISNIYLFTETNSVKSNQREDIIFEMRKVFKILLNYLLVVETKHI